MRKGIWLGAAVMMLAWLMGVTGCDDGGGDDDGGTDGDTDGDTDSDTDSDTDGDTDSDTDSDSDLSCDNAVGAPNPTQLGWTGLADIVQVRMGDGVAAVQTFFGISFVDVSDPQAPAVLSSETITAGDMVFDGDHLWVAENYQVRAIDLSDPSSPEASDPWTDTDLSGTAMIGSLAVRGDHLFLGVWNLGLMVLDISDPASPQRIGLGTGVDSFGAMAVDGDLLVAGTDGMVVFDISDPTAPALVGTYSGDNYDGQGVAAHDGYAYLADGTNGLVVIDLANPASPSAVGSLIPADTVGNYANFSFYDCERVYMGVANEVVYIIDVSDPTSPAEVGKYEWSSGGIHVRDRYAYGAGEYSDVFAVVQMFD